MKRNTCALRAKQLLDAFGKRYTTIEHDGGWCLYDSERPARRSNSKYIGKFYLSTNKDKYSFNDAYYDDVESLVRAMDEYNSTLPFDAEIYNPLFKSSYRLECAMYDYLTMLGFKQEGYSNSKYALYDCYDHLLCDLEVQITDGTTTGTVIRHVNRANSMQLVTTESPFTDLDSAIASVNAILATYMAAVGAQATNILGKITTSRSALMLDRTFDVRTLSVYTAESKDKMIRVLETELKQLKGE